MLSDYFILRVIYVFVLLYQSDRSVIKFSLYRIRDKRFDLFLKKKQNNVDEY